MNCIQIGFEVSGDNQNKLKDSVIAVAGADSKMALILASYFENEDFISYVKQELEVDNVLNADANKLRKLLRSYFAAQHLSVYNSTMINQAAARNGFLSEKAQNEAKAYTAEVLLNLYKSRAQEIKDKTLSYGDFLNMVGDYIKGTFITDVINPTISKLEKTHPNNSMLKKYKDLFQQIEETSNKLRRRTSLKKQFTKLREETLKIKDKESEAYINNKNELNRLNAEIDAITEDYKKGLDLNTLESEQYVIAMNIIAKFGTVQSKNYAALVSNLRGNQGQWFNSVFTKGSKLFNIRREFEAEIDENGLKFTQPEAVDEEDIEKLDNDDSIDEMSKSWSEALVTSFDKYADSETKFYLSGLYYLDNPVTKDTSKEAVAYNTNNELGVKHTIPLTFVIGQIQQFADYSSVDNFIQSIYEASQNIEELYGLSVLAVDMMNNRELANQIFHNLNNPKTIKGVITLDESGLTFDQSNKNLSVVTSLYYKFFNSVKATYKDVYSEHQNELVDDILNIIKNKIKFKTELSQHEIDNMIDTAYLVLQSYIPTINKPAISKYIAVNKNNIDNIKSFFDNINLLLQQVGGSNGLLKQYNIASAEYSKTLSVWGSEKRQSIELTGSFAKPKPAFPTNKVQYEKINAPCIEIAKKLSIYTAVKSELNSANAEGHLASDLLKNSYISRFMEQIMFGTKEEANKGLRLFKEWITKSPQYSNNHILFGVKNSKGKYIKEGIFIKDDAGVITINPNAKQLMNVILFDGVKDTNTGKSVMYQSMSKADYILTMLTVFDNPITTENLLGNTEVKKEYGGFFFQTPSDAPKNFIFQTIKYNIFGNNPLWKRDESSVRDIVSDFEKELINKYGKLINANIGVAKTKPENTPFEMWSDPYGENLGKGKEDKNIISEEDLYKLLIGELDTYKIKGFRKYGDKKNRQVPLNVKIDNDRILTVWITGETKSYDFDKLHNVKISSIDTIDGSNNLPKGLTSVLFEQIVKNNESKIRYAINTDNELFRVFHTQLQSDFVNFAHNLNNVFEEKNVRGKKVFKTRKTLDNLFEKAHYDSKEGIVGKNHKLAGNFFKFIKLFNTSDFNTSELIEELFSLYGQDSKVNLFIQKKDNKGNLILEINNDYIKDKNSFIKLSPSSKFEFVLNDEVNNKLNEIVSKWIISSRNDILKYIEPYSEMIQENGFSQNDVLSCFLNNDAAEMALDDLFTGGAVYHFDAREFLKRAKEIQAGGYAYGAYDLNEGIGGELITHKNSEGKKVAITINDVQWTSLSGRPLYAKNGFKAVTIANTVNSVEVAPRVKDELFEILSKDPTLSEEQAENISKEIASGYFANSKLNDAQSYITLDEFVARMYANGTLHHYKEILQQIKDVRDGKKDISTLDLQDINARIQVQKNFYFDHQYDKITGCYYPRQIKNAEFVLIPELIKGTELEDLYNLMDKYDIGQINTTETSKAAKRNIITYWDEHGVVTEDNKKVFEAHLANDQSRHQVIEDYYYQYLYKQQDVPQHMQDTKNKAGIQVMKKIIDNINDPTLLETVNEFLDAYVGNIKEDFNIMLDNMGWAIDEEGKLVNKNRKNENEPLNFEEFYKRARIEAQRLNMDSNFIDYLTVDNFGNPLMPNYMSNVSSKLESIAQSMFNSAITRQKLPGWHGAQVTGIGHGVRVKLADGTYSTRKLQYHPEVKDKEGNVVREAYAEVLIPRWSKLIPKDYDISKLETEGLDIQIGYRIPTEGKQSVSVLKVVGFLDDVYGSTVMVPDEWVVQTGSDFDVDSIYAIVYEMYMSKKTNTLKMYNPNVINTEEATRNRYIQYVNNRLDEKIDRDLIENDVIKNTLNNLRKSVRNVEELEKNLNNIGDLHSNSKELWEDIPVEYKRIIIPASKSTKEPNAERYTNMVNAVQKAINIETNKKNSDKTVIKNLNKLKENYEIIVSLNLLRQSIYEEDTKNYFNIKDDELKKLFKAHFDKYFNEIKNVAKTADIMSFEEFSKLSPIEQSSRKVRNNIILDAMVKIMKDPSSREENYSRSNFDDLSDANTKMNNLRGAGKITTSPYNVLTQIDFMENAISGKQLKAFSVTRDTFNSVNNRIKSRLTAPIKVIYRVDNGAYNEELLTTYSGETKLSEHKIPNREGKYFMITHKNWGWSNNNRNVVGKLLTPYSSQTTAHILDAIKEGTIFNENEFTFGTFKTLIDVGIDYETAIAFLMQPGITKINDFYYENKSIYANSNANPIHNAIKYFANELGITVNKEKITEFTPIKQVLQAINKNKEFNTRLKTLFGESIITDKFSFDKNILPIDGEMLMNRLQDNSEDNKAVNNSIDLAVALTFMHLHDITQKVESLTRVTNPDKFGAKQTIHSTRKVLRNIADYMHYDGETGKFNSTGEILVNENGFPMLYSIYPGFIETGYVDVENSKYKSLGAFLNFSTRLSVAANSELFTLESEYFDKMLVEFERQIGRELTEDQYKDYKHYLMNYVYSHIETLYTPLTLDEYDNVIPDTERDNADTANEFYNQEVNRIIGYDVLTSNDVVIQDINNPTGEELREFNKLTPAQKVLWIQHHFTDGRGICDFLNVNLFNQNDHKNKKPSRQRITYSDQIDDVEELLNAFSNSYYNRNKLIRLTCIDLVKYAFVSEGFRFKKGNITKIIPNKILYSSVDNKGLDIIYDIEHFINIDLLEYNIENFIDGEFVSPDHEDLYDNMAKANKELIPEVRLNKRHNNILSKLRATKIDNMHIIPITYGNKELLEYLRILPQINNKLAPAGSTSSSFIKFKDHELDVDRKYIRITQKNGNTKKTVLYKIVAEMDNNNSVIALIPLNTLDNNEVDISINYANNSFMVQDYYLELFNLYKQTFTYENINEYLKSEKGKERRKKSTIPRFESTVKLVSTDSIDGLVAITKENNEGKAKAVSNFIDEINKALSTFSQESSTTGTFIEFNNVDISSLFEKNKRVIQQIPINETESRYVFITKKGLTGKQKERIHKRINEGFVTPQESIFQTKKPKKEKPIDKIIDTTKVVNPIIYNIRPLTDVEIAKLESDLNNAKEQLLEEVVAEEKRVKEEIALSREWVVPDISEMPYDVPYSIIRGIGSRSEDKTFTEAGINESARDLARSIYREANTNEVAAQIKQNLQLQGFDINEMSTVERAKEDIYKTTAEYYEQKAKEHIKNIEEFVVEDGRTFSLDDEELYKYMIEHPEIYPLVLSIILDAKHFGSKFDGILHLDAKGETPDVQNNIRKLQKAINDVRNNPKLKKATKQLFNVYLANEFSSNPLIRNAYIELTTTFGDTDWFDLTFSDLGELNHSQVQVVVKYVYTILNEANNVLAPRAVEAFDNRFKEIINNTATGNFNWDNVINKEGKLATPYNEKFLEDRRKHIDDVLEAKEKYGVDSIEYIKAKLANDKWKAKNLEQEVLQDYYLRDIALREKVLSECPDLYVEYMRLSHELQNIDPHLDRIEKIETRKRINAKISHLLNEKSYLIDDPIFGPMPDEAKMKKVDALKEYINNKKLLNGEYFEYTPTEQFNATLKQYQNYIKNYDTKYPHKTLLEKFQNEDYKDAYTWIEANATYRLDEKSSKEIKEAFNKLKDKTKSVLVSLPKDVYDSFGVIDGRKVSEEDRKTIMHNSMITYFGKDSFMSDSRLIKEIPSNIPIFSDKVYAAIRGEKEMANITERNDIIEEINSLISQFVDKNGRINSVKLINTLKEADLERLTTLYSRLSNLTSNKNKLDVEEIKKHISFRSNYKAFNREHKRAIKAFGKSSAKMKAWEQIFVAKDQYGNLRTNKDDNYIPNNQIFGYIEPKKVLNEDDVWVYDSSLVNREKTRARNLINDCVEFVETEYYYIAEQEALENGTYNEWYKENHIFNPYTHKWETLRIWTTMRVKPSPKHKNIVGEYEYKPNIDNTVRSIKDGKNNKKYNRNSVNYNISTGSYGNFEELSNKEKEMVNFLQNDVLNHYAKTISAKQFLNQGFAPRRRKVDIDKRYIITNAFGALGVEMGRTGESAWTDNIGYEKDFNADFPMLQLLKEKGSKKLIDIPVKSPFMDQETYDKEVEKIKKANEEIIKNNLEIDNAILDRDWENVFRDFVSNAVVYNAREQVKDTVYLLLDDLRESQAYKVSKVTGNLIKDNTRSSDTTTHYRTIDQRNTIDLVENWARRTLFNQFKQPHKMSKYADLLQNMTSAKYMIGNLTGGISNITVGKVNIFNEVFAQQFFDNETFYKARIMYATNVFAYLANDENNFENAIINRFNVVNYDEVLQRRPNETVHNYTKRVRSMLYGFQTGGEHYMQNSVLFAMLKSHRVFRDGDKLKIGSLADYTWNLEKEAMLEAIGNRDDLRLYYDAFLTRINNDISLQKDYAEFRRDYNQDFLREINDKSLSSAYNKAVEELIKNAKVEFESNFKTAEEYLYLNTKNKRIEIKPEFDFDENDLKQLDREFSYFAEKVKSVNKKIHGVYDKIGAARIEKEWWGSLVMQYHKHIYPGIMKRWRRKGYFNEVRGIVEKGSYISVYDLLSYEFKNAINAYKDDQGKVNALNSLKAIYQGTIETVVNLGTNWQNLPRWEKANIKRVLGDLRGVVSAFLLGILLHAMTDDDDLKDSEVLATTVYLIDRLGVDSQMFTPWGMYTEASTLWSTPIAATSSCSDLLKGLSIGTKMLFDDDFDPYYTTGLYRGKHKASVLFYRNIPLVRVYNRLTNMTRNNNYYRINETSNIIGTSKNVADFINPD